MSAAQSWLVAGGVFNIFLSVLVAYALYWVRLRDPQHPSSRAALTAHKATLWNGFLLLSLSVAIEHTGYVASVNTLLAIFEVVATLLSDGRNIVDWAQGIDDEFMRGPEWRVRLRGLGNLLHVVATSAIFVGVMRTVLGLY